MPSYQRTTLESIDHLVRFLAERRSQRMVFRGQSEATWELEPSIFRPGIIAASTTKERVKKERALLEKFKRRARPYLTDRPPDDKDYEWLALARHCGLPTRLLDWSESAGVALFLAVNKPKAGKDSILWCSERPEEISSSSPGPFDIDDIFLYDPPHIAPRISVQQALFTVHPSNYKDKKFIWPRDHESLVIPEALRQPMRDFLEDIGINYASLCPEPEGIATHLREQFARQ